VNLRSIKTAADVQLAGITVDLERRDNSITAIVLRDGKGGLLKVCRGESYSSDVKLYVPEPPKVEDRWRVSGDFDGAPIRKVFEHEHEADDFARRLESRDIKAKKERVKVEVKDDGSEAEQSAAPVGAFPDEAPF
jgi:hypothetical protein